MATDFYYGSDGRPIELERSADTLAVSYRQVPSAKDRDALIRGDEALAAFIAAPDLLDRNIVLFKRGPNAVASLEDFAERVNASPAVAFAASVYRQGTSVVVITDEFVAAFKPEVTRAQIDQLNAAHNVQVVELLRPPSTYLLRVRQSGVRACLPAAVAYYESGLCRYAEPNRIRAMELFFQPNDVFFSRQWHLPRVHAEEAWDLTRGSDSVILAILDDAIDIDHEDINAPGRIVAPLDLRSGDNDPRPGPGDSHGTAVTGVALALGSNGIGVTGIAPGCRLIPIRFVGLPVGDVREANAVRHAVDNHASIISNSWGPPAGAGTSITGLLSDEFDHAITAGRGGKGCIILFAAGNNNLSISAAATRNGYADDSRVIAVAAVNNKDVRSGYSNFGEGIDICAPSNGSRSAGIAPPFPDDGSTLNVFTTDVTGAGYNPAPPIPSPPPGMALESSPDLRYTSTFGGTSSACPLAAGIVALMLSANEDLTRDQAQFVLEATADKVDATNTDPVGQYQPNGHSHFYGFGSVNALQAVRGARSLVGERDFADRILVTLRRTTGNEFVAVDALTAVDARRRPAASERAIRASEFGILRAEIPGLADEVEVDR